MSIVKGPPRLLKFKEGNRDLKFLFKIVEIRVT